MKWRNFILALLLFVGLIPLPCSGHDGQPVQVDIKEREPGAFLVQYLVPKVLATKGIPTLILPESCQPQGERITLDKGGGWLIRQLYKCSEGLSGQAVGINYTFSDPSLTTIFRIELLSGEQFVRVLSSFEQTWTLPEAHQGALAVWVENAQSSVLIGARHIIGYWEHLAFLIIIVILGGATSSIRLVTAFSAGQLVSVGITLILGRSFDQTVAEICVALAVVFLAREVFRSGSNHSRKAGLAFGGGLFHGLALAALLPADSGTLPEGWSHLIILVLGIDATLLILTATLNGFQILLKQRWSLARLRPVLAYLVGGATVASGLMLGFEPPHSNTAIAMNSNLPIMTARASSNTPASQQVFPQSADVPFQSFLSIEPFEVRHEVLVQLRSLPKELDLGYTTDSLIGIDAQKEIADKLGKAIKASTTLIIDGQPAEGLINRTGFMTSTPLGVLFRQELVTESIQDGLVGVTLVYPTKGVPETLSLSWTPIANSIPATIVDPESSQSTILTSDQPSINWRNKLVESPIPNLVGLAVEPPSVPVPLVTMLIFVAAIAGSILEIRSSKRIFMVTRILLAIMFFSLPYGQLSLALPNSWAKTISQVQARRVLAGLLPNVYRAFEFREEEMVYDRLAIAVTGETLTEVYLKNRRALEMTEQGGGTARVDAVELLNVGAIQPNGDSGFATEVHWSVGGTVTHFGHRHFRQNRYQALVTVVPTEGLWKINSMEIIDQERVR